MRTNERIRRVLASGLLRKDLTRLPTHGASVVEIAETESQLAHPLSDAFKGVVREWNGLDLEVVRVCGVGRPDDGFDAVLSYWWLAAAVGPRFNAVASDPDGFVYGEQADGSILQWDHDGGGNEVVAPSFEDCICGLVFGERAAEFSGEEWLAGLRGYSIIAA